MPERIEYTTPEATVCGAVTATVTVTMTMAEAVDYLVGLRNQAEQSTHEWRAQQLHAIADELRDRMVTHR